MQYTKIHMSSSENTEVISKEKKRELQKELDYLKTDRRKELAENLQKARALGDLSENAEYHNAREEQGFSEDRIRQIEYILKNAKVLDEKTSKVKAGVVSVGSKVEIRKRGVDEKGKAGRWETKTKIIEIVGGEESDMLTGKISFKSPLGSVLMGQVESVEVVVATPKGQITYKIVAIG